MENATIDRDTFGVLVGWTHTEFANKLDLRLQTVKNSSALSQDEIDNHHIVMTMQQATLLANYLFNLTGQTPVRRSKQSFLARWLGE